MRPELEIILGDLRHVIKVRSFCSELLRVTV